MLAYSSLQIPEGRNWLGSGWFPVEPWVYIGGHKQDRPGEWPRSEGHGRHLRWGGGRTLVCRWQPWRAASPVSPWVPAPLIGTEPATKNITFKLVYV